MLIEASSDGTLAAAAAGGDRDAFDALVRRYGPRVSNLVRASCRREHDADDLVQDVFIRAYRGIRRFRGESSFWSWLYRIATNVVFDDMARGGRAGTVVLEPGAASPEAVEAVAASGDLELRTIRRQAIARALASLPLELRRLVLLRDVEGLDYDEIARIARLPRGTVDSRLFRARRRLRPLLAAVAPHRAARSPPGRFPGDRRSYSSEVQNSSR